MTQKTDTTAATSKFSSSSAHPQTAQELTEFVEHVLSTLDEKLESMSSQILTKMNDMSSRVDQLEKSISELMDQQAEKDQN